MKRRDFVRVIGGVVLAGAALKSTTGCGGDDDDGNNDQPDSGQQQADCNANGATAGTITGNHGHTLTVPAADISAGAAKTYNIDGAAGHPHTIDLSAADMTTLAGGASVTVTSSNDLAHTHNVTVVCA